MANQDLLLNFAKFKLIEVRNNFHMHFVGKENGDAFLGDAYRSQEHYKRCMKECSEFADMVAELRKREDHYSPEYIEKLYEAYKLMRPYAPNDWAMFK